jgi:hypothetical protein
MKWIKLTHSTGANYINLERVYMIDGLTSTTAIVFYDSSSILPVTYTFSSSAEKDEALLKLEAILASIDLDRLAPQI